MANDQEISRNLSLIEYYKEQLSSLDIQSQYLQAAIADYQKAKITVEQLGKTDDGTDILVPVGSGIFINASAKDTSKILLDVGAGVVTEKTVEDAIQKIDERIKQLEESQKKLLAMAERIQTDATELSNKTQQMVSQSPQKG